MEKMGLFCEIKRIEARCMVPQARITVTIASESHRNLTELATFYFAVETRKKDRFSEKLFLRNLDNREQRSVKAI